MGADRQDITLADICRTNTSTYSGKEMWEYVDYLDTGNITQGVIETLQHFELPQEKLPSRARRKVQPNDIIYSTVRPDQLHYGFMNEVPDNFLVSTGFTVITVDPSRADPKFVYYFLTQDYITQSLHSIAEQSVTSYPSIKASDIEALNISLPSIEEQRKIASILSSLDDKIALNQKINANLQAQAAAVFEHTFPYDINDELPDGWRVGQVGDIVEIHDSKRIPLSSADRAKMAKIYPYYGAASLMDHVDNYIFDGVYLLLGEDGSVVDDAGYPILQYVWGKFWVNNHAHILTGKLGFSVETLYLLFRRTPVREVVTGAVQPKISQANLRSIKIVLPPSDKISAFHSLIRPLFEMVRQNEEENKRLAAIRDALLPRLMSGEIDVSGIELGQDD